MVKPVDEINPTSGEGKEKYDPNQKRGPGKFDEVLEKSRADRLKAAADKVKIAPLPEGTPNLDKAISDMEALREKMEARKAARAARGGAGTGGGSGGADLKSITNPKSMKKGGKVKSASARADGCAIRGKIRA